MGTRTLGRFSSGTFLITGGTGSFGRQIAKSLLNLPVEEIRIFSRDEDLQRKMAAEFEDDRLKFLIGDVRDRDRLTEVMRMVDCVIHAAALKQVPDCENHPFEAVQTNILGAQNVKSASEVAGVSALVFISTDKAVKPVNAMGMTKALQEKIFLSPEMDHQTRICGVRYGNVLGSRGSVVPHFVDLKRQGKPLVVTHQDMTRFILTLRDAVSLVFSAISDGIDSELFVMKRPACKIFDLAEVVSEGKVPIRIGNIRAGEKIHETLVQEEEMRRSIEDSKFYRIRSYGSKGVPRLTSRLTEYTSENTKRMTRDEISELLRNEGWL